MELAITKPAGGIQEKLSAAFPALTFEIITPTLIRIEADKSIQVGPLVRFMEDQNIDIAEARRMRPSLLGFFIAVSVSEVFEAQTFSNFFRFPMIFLCGLFFPIEKLPLILQPLSYILPLTYGADILHGAVQNVHPMPYALSLSILGVFAVILFAVSLWNIKRKWIV
ncbi:MAG: ABC transporter permease [Deltaproteobacteria bacterium]|nr:ABC transporter permease [Deltaproteobacteria bacterium]